jgi:hypothetical protein
MHHAPEPSLDLDRLIKRLVTGDGIITPELACHAIEEYKKFLILCSFAQDAGQMLVPPAMVDMVWQRHQLDTANYFADCSYLCIPGGYLHRHCTGIQQDELSAENKANDDSTCPLKAAYEKTFQLYKETFGVAPNPNIWPGRLVDTTSPAVDLGVAIPQLDIALSCSQGAPTEDKLVSELLWVGEVVRAELPAKQARCPGKSEPINQIRFHPLRHGFVPSAEQEQQRLEVVVREYVRFLVLVMKYHHGDASEEDEGRTSTDMTVDQDVKQMSHPYDETALAAKVGLAAKKTHFQVTPSKLVDELWHAHILRSPAYFQFCLQYSPRGRYVHHEPHFDKPHNYHEPGFAETVKAYATLFGCPPRDVWGVLGESGGGGGDKGHDGGSDHECGDDADCGGNGGCGGEVFPSFRNCGPFGPLTLSCGACSALNGNQGEDYVTVQVKQEKILTMEGTGHNNRVASFKMDFTYRHNQMVNRDGELYVIARSNLRTAAYLAARYGQAPPTQPHWIAHFPRVAAPSHLFLGDLFVNAEVYAHVQRQIHLCEAAMYEAAKAIAALRKADLTELETIHGTTATARLALFHDWWARNSQCTELMKAMNQLLAPFNVQLVKFVETKKHMNFDHYALKPTVTPWAPQASSISDDARGHYTEQWEQLLQRLHPRKLELERKWFKPSKQWEHEVYSQQIAWLSSVTQSLQAADPYVPYMHTTVSPHLHVCSDLRFMARVDHKALIQTNVLADRVYLRVAFLNVHPKVVPPMSSLHPDEQVAAALDVPGLIAGTATEAVLIKVTAVSPVGSNMTVTVPVTGRRYSLTVPRGAYPGTFFWINVPVIASTPRTSLTTSPLASSATQSVIPLTDTAWPAGAELESDCAPSDHTAPQRKTPAPPASSPTLAFWRTSTATVTPEAHPAAHS